VVPSPFLAQTLTDMGFPRDRVEQVQYRDPAAPAVVVPSPFLVQTLTDMGFPRDRVEQVQYRDQAQV
jgi:hypothetical protein